MPMHFTKLGKGRVRKDTVAGSNIYTGMVSRNLTEHTYTTWVDGTGIAVHPQARQSHGGDLQRSQTPTFAARQPKGMTVRTASGPVEVHMNPYQGYIAKVQ